MKQLKLGIVFDTKTGKFITDVKKSGAVIRDFGNQTQQASYHNKTFSTSVDNVNNRLAVTNSLAKTTRNAIAGMVSGFGAFQLASSLTQELAQFQDIRTRIQGLSKDAADYAEKERWLIDLAKNHHKELTGLADGYSRLSALTQEQIINDGQARDMLAGLSNAASKTGASSEDLGRVYYGLAQALGQGVVQMQEVNQVVEPLPGLMSKLARAAGEETSAGLKTLIASGTVTSEVFGELLVTALKEYDGAAAKTADNINTKYRDIKREYQLLAVELEQPINSALLPTLDGITTGLQFLGEHTDALITTLSVGLVVATGHAANAVVNKTAVTIKDVLAEKAAAQSAVAHARSEIALATIQRNGTLIITERIAAESRLVAARTALTTATTRLSIASRGLGLMSSIVGGLPGLLTIAAFAMYSFASSTGNAADQAKRLNDEHAKLNPFAGYTLKRAQVAIVRYKGMLKLAEQMADETRTRFKNPYFNTTAEDVEAEEKKVEGLAQKVAALQLVINKANSPTTKKDQPQDNKILDSYNKQLGAQKQQLALLGQTTELARIEYATTKGKFQHLLPAQKVALLNIAKEMDTKTKRLAVDRLAQQQATQAAEQAKRDARQLNELAAGYALSLQQKATLTGETSEVARLNFELEHGSLQGINDELRTHLQLLAEKADRATADAEAQQPFWDSMKEHIRSTSQDFDTMWGNTFNNFAQGVGDAVGTAITEGQNFGDAMKSIAKSAIKEVISGLVQIAVKKLALAAIEKTIGVTGAATNVATAAATGTAIATAMAPAAAMASLASFGGNSVPAMTGIATTVALSEGLALAGMAHDGIDSIPREGTWLLDKGERVVDRRTNADLKLALKGGQMGGSNITINLIEDTSQAGQATHEKGLSGEDVIRIFVADIRQGGDSADAMELTYGLQRTGT
ncbi:MAG: tape measure protein [Gammaproteobacteria bacterium]|nr:tape measure protein [Gammaproteobacteria bacterium]